LGRIGVAATVVALSLAGTHAHAQDEPPADEDEARALFELASVHYRDGRFLDAAGEFARAYELSGRAELTHNIYLCYRDANRPADAAIWLRRYLESDAEIENRDFLQARLDALESEDGESEEPTEEPEAHGEGGRSTANIVGHATSFTVSGLTLITAFITGGMVIAIDSDLSERCMDMTPCADPSAEADKDTMQTLALVTDIMFATSLVTATIGLVLILAGGGDEEESPVACGPRGCNVGWAF